ncbi:bifunctional DNA-formamidopyrimidine glycosylase/DNA-(apurinic or apyrimidinic site) lyase [Rhodoligotrophos defluvii]|uniref:bifunctional DNA-formamidopyrimidine glycosylase/DNA-(apurinic or apyrimidinic site) lyase n=1 Tax=Rhodoligotrophos defluvii TaxID=2561934 RepID=UPI0010CA0EF9|nr:bifunctional DNA-formamidopyrimidine glycosylase/DNA-(apurinic or apyrimidinic site) lyase [Rhodoligotrophos defluvii]
MPELPEVETVRRGLAGVMAGHRIDRLELRRHDLRFPFPPDFRQRLQGARVERIDRRAKYLLGLTDRGDVLIMHLGMSGRFTIVPPEGQARKPGTFYHAAAAGAGEGPHDHVIFAMDDGTRIVYADPRRFGIMDLAVEEELAAHRLLKDIGMEPLDDAFDAAYLGARFAGRQAPLKAALLDQRIIAGLGNIYVCEALFRAGLSPERKAGSLSPQGLERLVGSIKAVLQDAIAAGGSSLRDYAQANGELGYFQHTFEVYDREGQPCRRGGCGGTVERVVQSGRSTFYCRTCQR